MSIRRLLTTLVDGSVRFVIVGMVAGNIHGSRYTTEDLDVVYEASGDNCDAICKALLPPHPRAVDAWPLEDTTDMTTELLSAERSLTVLTDEGELDLLHRIDGVGGYEEVLSASSAVLIEGRAVRVITFDALIATKRASARPKDLLHLPDLELIEELRNNGANEKMKGE